MSKFSKSNLTILLLFGLIGQIAWSVENMYFNLFVFDTISPSLETVTLMVQLSGITATVNEDDINTVIAASGSSPAYIMRFANTLIEYAASKGITADDSKKLVVQTLAGCAKLMSESDKSISQLIADVTSPNGTTAAGLKSLDDNSFNDIVIKCLDETVKRAEELSK